MGKKVSVVIPTFNRAFSLPKCLKSVFEQTYENLEIIVIDDGSTDNTQELIKELIAEYDNRLIYHRQDNAGVSSARNTGIGLATGEFVAFLDSDDSWHSEKIQQQVDLIEQYPEVDLVYTLSQTIDENGQVAPYQEPQGQTLFQIESLKEVLANPYLTPSTVMVRRSIFDDVGRFDVKLKTAEDIDFFLKVSLRHPIGRINRILVDYTLTKGSLGSENISYEDHLFVIKRFFDANKEACEVNGFQIDDALYEINFEYAKTLLWKGSTKKARQRILIAWRYKKTLILAWLWLKSFIK